MAEEVVRQGNWRCMLCHEVTGWNASEELQCQAWRIASAIAVTVLGIALDRDRDAETLKAFPSGYNP